MSNELIDVRCHCGAEFPADSYDAGFIAGSGMCQFRAALAQPSLMPPDRGPWHAVKWDGGRRVDLSSDDFEHDVALTVSGDFVEGDKFRYAQELAAWRNAHLAQPSPKSGYYSDQEWINAGCPPEQPSQSPKVPTCPRSDCGSNSKQEWCPACGAALQ
ncbi:hypothetical protein ACM75K_28980 [Pseudomonas aeruginosa]